MEEAQAWLANREAMPDLSRGWCLILDTGLGIA